MSLSKKMLRDIKINKTQFLAIFLMAFLGIFAYCGIYGEYYGLVQTSDAYYAQTNMADGWIYNTRSKLQMHTMLKPIWLMVGFTILVLMILRLIR